MSAVVFALLAFFQEQSQNTQVHIYVKSDTLSLEVKGDRAHFPHNKLFDAPFFFFPSTRKSTLHWARYIPSWPVSKSRTTQSARTFASRDREGSHKNQGLRLPSPTKFGALLTRCSSKCCQGSQTVFLQLAWKTGSRGFRSGWVKEHKEHTRARAGGSAL